MATRADFYVKNDTVRYLGSIAFDGYSIGEKIDLNSFSPNKIGSRSEDYLEYLIRNCKNEQEYINLVNEFLTKRDDGSIAEIHGFPFPWSNSKLTDCVYLFDAETNKLLKMYDYIGDYEDHLTPGLFIAVDSYDCDTDGNEIELDKIKILLPDLTEIKKPAMGTKRDSIIMISM